jgi:hypothetical protein
MMGFLIRATIVASFISAATPVRADVSTVSHTQPTREAYEACLSSEATQGGYTASDGGISALRLMDQCRPQLDEWRVDCMAAGQTVNQCNLIAASYAQAVLEKRRDPPKP